MIRATINDRNIIVNILTDSFNDNLSVNYIIKQDDKRQKRIQALMNYSFDICYYFGEVYLSEDKNACALVVLPDKKRTTLKAIFLDIRLIFKCTGIQNLKKAMLREKKIKQAHTDDNMYYLWFIGVKKEMQKKGIGTKLLKEVINEGIKKNRNTYLETSTPTNIPWYVSNGFEIYNQIDLSYTLFFLRNR